MNRHPSATSRSEAVRLGLLTVAILVIVWTVLVAFEDGFAVRSPLGTLSSRTPARPFLIAVTLAVLYLALYRNHLQADARRLANMPWSTIIATVLTIAAFLIGVEYCGFSGAGPDASAYVSQAHEWTEGNLHSPIPEWAVRATWTNAIPAGGPVGYTTDATQQAYVPMVSLGLPVIMSLFERAGGADAVFYVVPLSGALVVWGAYLLGRRLAGEWAGAMAAALVLFSPAFLWLLIVPMSDVPVAACWTMALVLAMRARGTADALASGIAVGVAILIRPNVAPLAVFPALLLLLSDSRRLTKVGLFGLSAIPAVLVIAMMNERWYGSPLRSGYGSLDMLYAAERIPVNLQRYGGWLVDTQTPLVLVWAAAPFVVNAYDLRRRLLLLLLYPLAVLAMYMAYLNFNEWGYLRFLLPAYPVMLASVAAVFVSIARRLQPAGLAAAAAVIVMLSMLVHEWRFASNAGTFRIAEGETRFAHAVGFAKALPPTSILISDAYSGTLHFYTGRDVLRWRFLDRHQIDDALADLKERGHRLYFIGDPFEVREFKEYFSGSTAATRFETQTLQLWGEVFVASDLTPP
jgi:dolichyl-phosphate-mannose-protein mannosyltransferase